MAALVLVPPALDPTECAAVEFGVVVLYYLLETLVHVWPKWALTQLLAESAASLGVEPQQLGADNINC